MKDRVFSYIKGIADRKGIEVTEETDLFSEGILDSMGIISLLSYLKEEYGLSFSPDDMRFENFQTIDRILVWIGDQQKLK